MSIRRRKYLVNTGYQFKIILIFAGISFIGGLIAAGTLNFFSMKKLETIMWSTHINAQSTGELIKPLFLKINIAGFIFIALLLAVAAFLILRKTSDQLSHISFAINRTADGHLNTDGLHDQKSDFNELTHDIQQMAASIGERYKAVSNQYAQISKHLPEITANTPVENYNRLLSEITTLEDKLGEFTVFANNAQ